MSLCMSYIGLQLLVLTIQKAANQQLFYCLKNGGKHHLNRSKFLFFFLFFGGEQISWLKKNPMAPKPIISSRDVFFK